MCLSPSFGVHGCPSKPNKHLTQHKRHQVNDCEGWPSTRALVPHLSFSRSYYQDTRNCGLCSTPLLRVVTRCGSFLVDWADPLMGNSKQLDILGGSSFLTLALTENLTHGPRLSHHWERYNLIDIAINYLYSSFLGVSGCCSASNSNSST